MSETPKPTGKRFSSVNDLVKATSKDTAFKKAFDEEFHAKKITCMLSAARAAKGVTQAQLAKKIGCGQARISKIENGRDSQLRIQDLADYSKALGFNLGLGINGKPGNAVEEIKFHAFEIKHRLEKLAELAHEDDGIYEGVSGFFSEAFFNMLKVFEKASSKLPKKDSADHIDVFTDISPSSPRPKTLR